MLENVWQRYLTENLPINCGGILFNETAVKSSRSAISFEKNPPQRRFTCKYISTFSASRGRSYRSSVCLIRLRVVYDKAAALLRRWSTIDFFLQKRILFNILFKTFILSIRFR